MVTFSLKNDLLEINTTENAIVPKGKLREKLTNKRFMFYFVKIVNYFLNLFKKGDTIKVLFIKK